jgi:hypothetical protein
MATNEVARIQNNGEKRLSRKKLATTARPVTFEVLTLQRAITIPGHNNPGYHTEDDAQRSHSYYSSLSY